MFERFCSMKQSSVTLRIALLLVDDSIHLTTKENDAPRQVEPGHQHDDTRQGHVGLDVSAEQFERVYDERYQKR